MLKFVSSFLSWCGNILHAAAGKATADAKKAEASVQSAVSAFNYSWLTSSRLLLLIGFVALLIAWPAIFDMSTKVIIASLVAWYLGLKTVDHIITVKERGKTTRLEARLAWADGKLDPQEAALLRDGADAETVTVLPTVPLKAVAEPTPPAAT